MLHGTITRIALLALGTPFAEDLAAAARAWFAATPQPADEIDLARAERLHKFLDEYEALRGGEANAPE